MQRISRELRHFLAGPTIATVTMSFAVLLVTSLALPGHAYAAADGCAESLTSEAAPNGAYLLRTANPQPAEGNGLIGIWTASQTPSNNSGLHCHTLTIHFESGPGAYAATVDTSTPNGWSYQFCTAARDGDRLALTCDVVAQDMPYNADNFSLTIDGPLLLGRNVDDAGVTGAVRFCRN